METEKQNVNDGPASSSVAEGQVVVKLPGDSTVFYNPVQEFNRDLSVAVLRQFVYDLQTNSEGMACGSSSTIDPEKLAPLTKRIRLTNMRNAAEEGIVVLEALAASGLRSVRYAKEVPHVKQVIANDLSQKAVNYIIENAESNGVSSLISPNCDDCVSLMHKYKNPQMMCHVVDIDPYGCPSPFLDAAVQCVADGGVLMVTCTDMAVLCGNSPETCHSKYGSVSLKVRCCHEFALRILLRCIESHANRYSRYIQPLLSVSVDFYVRVFVKVYTRQATVKESICKLSMVYHCNGCESLTLQPLMKKMEQGNSLKFVPAVAPVIPNTCQHCHSNLHIGGPIWTGPLHDVEFVNRLLSNIECEPDERRLNTHKRIVGMLSVVAEELQDVPLFYLVSKLTKVLHCPVPKMTTIRSALLNGGYRVSGSHCHPQALKTDAPNRVIWDILRCWVKAEKIELSALSTHSPAKAVFDQPPEYEADFSEHPLAEPKSKQDGLLRFQMNPEKNWGPKPRAKNE